MVNAPSSDQRATVIEWVISAPLQLPIQRPALFYSQPFCPIADASCHTQTSYLVSSSHLHFFPTLHCDSVVAILRFVSQVFHYVKRVASLSYISISKVLCCRKCVVWFWSRDKAVFIYLFFYFIYLFSFAS